MHSSLLWRIKDKNKNQIKLIKCYMQNMVEGGDEDWRLVDRDVVKGLVFH